MLRLLPIRQDIAYCIALLGRKRKYIKLKTTGKLKGKQTLIPKVRDQFLSFATFPTPLPSRYRLPLRCKVPPVSLTQVTNLQRLAAQMFFVKSAKSWA